MQENKYYKQYVDRLDVNVNIIDKLKENKIRRSSRCLIKCNW